MSSPSSVIVPLVGSTSRRIALPVVDLPQPLSPTRPSVSPAARSNDTPSTACTVPTSRAEQPAAHRVVLDQRVDLEHGSRCSRLRHGPSPAACRRSSRRRNGPARLRPPADTRRGTARSHTGSAARTCSLPAMPISDGTTPGISVSRCGRAGLVRRAIEPRDRRHQPARIRMARPREQRLHRRLLDLAARVHHDHALRGLGDHAEVVRDEHDRGAGALLQLQHQVEDLRLDGDVERRRRLVGDQDRRRAGHRDRDHHALPHAAGELMRIFAGAPPRLGNLHEREHLDRPVERRAPRQMLVQGDALGDLPADGHHRIEARHRLLEDHADPVAANRAHRAPVRASAAPRRRSGCCRRRCGPPRAAPAA